MNLLGRRVRNSVYETVKTGATLVEANVRSPAHWAFAPALPSPEAF